MSDSWGQPIAVFSTWFVCTVLASWAAALAYRALHRRLALLTPENRNALQVQIALMPVVLAGVATLWVFQPVLAFALLPEHCHGSVCSPHEPLVAIDSLGGIALTGLGALAFGCCLALFVAHLMRGRRQQQLLDCLSRSEEGYRIVESSSLQAWCLGLWSPQVYLSSDAVKLLSPSELRVVLAHEYCHVLRRDNLRRLLLSVATLLWPPGSRRQLQRGFALSTEQVCDKGASVAVGDSGLVSATIGRVASVQSPQVVARQQALHLGAVYQRALKVWVLAALLWAVQFIALLVAAHLLLEGLLPVESV